MKITTTPNRVLNAEYVCYEAKASCDYIVKALGITFDTEIDVQDVLRYLSVSDTMVALGEPRPRYKKQAELVLRQFIEYIFELVQKALEKRILARDITSLKPERNSYHSPSRRKNAEILQRRWAEVKSQTEDPDLRALCSILILLLSDYPLKLKAAHVAKDIRNVTEYRYYDPTLRQVVKELLDG